LPARKTSLFVAKSVAKFANSSRFQPTVSLAKMRLSPYVVRVWIPPSPPRTVFRPSRIFRWRPCPERKRAIGLVKSCQAFPLKLGGHRDVTDFTFPRSRYTATVQRALRAHARRWRP